MSRRNFTLLIIILVIIAIVIFIFLYFFKGPSTPDDGTGTNFFAGWGPFKKKVPAPEAPEVEEPPVEIPQEGGEVPIKLHKISTMPIAGYGIFTKERFKDIPVVTPPTPTPEGVEVPTENTVPETASIKTPVKKPTPPPTEFMTALRYVAKATGNIYQTFADKIEERKFSSTVVPQVYDAYFGTKAESVIMRYLKYDNSTIASFAGALPKELLGADGTETNEVKGSFLPENISDISISPDLSKMFYLFNTQENAIGTTSGTLGDKKIQVFDSPFQEWLAWWPNPSMITLTTKPSSGVPGYMYAVDPSKKDFNQILGNISGLTTLASPDGKLVLYADSNLSLGVYNIKSRSSNSLPVRTLPEKCTWGLKSDIVYCAVPKYLDTVSYPDAWYMGKVSFSDEIWQLNITTGNSTILVDPLSVIGGEDIDGIKMALDKDESYLFFVNKKDSFLWELELK